MITSSFLLLNIYHPLSPAASDDKMDILYVNREASHREKKKKRKKNF